jgi:hypothetical protein
VLQFDAATLRDRTIKAEGGEKTMGRSSLWILLGYVGPQFCRGSYVRAVQTIRRTAAHLIDV